MKEYIEKPEPQRPPFKINKTILNTIFSFALVILILFTFYSYQEFKNLFEVNRLVVHTHEVVSQIDSSLYALSDLESDQRGYLVTNDRTYLQEMGSTKEELKQGLNNLDNLTRDNEDQNVRVKEFSQLVGDRVAILEQVADLKANDKLQTPEGMKLFERGNELSSKTKQLGRELKSVEMTLLEYRNMSLLNKAEKMNYFVLFGSIISLVFLSIPFLLASRELKNRKLIEMKNKNTRSHLRQIIEGVSEMIAALDEKNNFQIFNEAYQREFKLLFNKSLTIGINIDEAFSNVTPERKDIANCWKKSLLPLDETTSCELVIDGKHIVYEFNATQIIDENKQIIGVVHSIRNITEKVKEHTELQVAYETLSEKMAELKNKNNQITLLVEMSDIMLATNSQEELSKITTEFAKQLLVSSSGYLFIMHPSRNYLEKAGEWGTPSEQEKLFGPNECWAIRLGKTYQKGKSDMELVCEHISNKTAEHKSSICLPLMAQNDIYGLLYIEFVEQVDLTEDQKLVTTALGELTALALANVRLRENLQYQSIRDALTGLYNRRYLEDALRKQLHQSERSKSSFAVLVLDLDHFKKINDTFGHDAGDAVLKEVGKVLEDRIRAGDVASRYGGEEFVLVLHNIDLVQAKKKAEEIRKSVAKLQVKYGAQDIGPITISSGLALYPIDDRETEGLFEKADKALYIAKNNGRNKVVVFSESQS